MSDSRSSSPVLPFYRQDVTLANAVDPDYDIEAQDRAPNDYNAPALARHYLTQISNGLFEAGRGAFSLVKDVFTFVGWLIFCILKIPSLIMTGPNLVADVLRNLMGGIWHQ